MDFTKYGLEGEMLAKATADYEADILGLKGKNAELIGKEQKLKADMEALALENATKIEDAKLEALAAQNGTIEQYQAQLKEKDDNLAIVKQEFKQAEEGRIMSDKLSEFSSKLADDAAGRMYMQSLFKESVEFVDGQLRAKDQTSSIEQVAEALISDKANARYIATNVGSGAGSVGSNSYGTVSANRSKMNADQKADYISEHGQDAYLQLPK